MTNVRPWDMLKNKHEGKGKRVSLEVSEKRMSICEACPSLKAGLCTECGCRMKWKTTLAYASCPLHKWEAED
jgi:hypothetical protein